MLHSEARAKSERSIHTIMDNTRVIDVIEPRSLFPDTVEVRRMLSRTHKESQHFIVTLFSDIQSAQDTQVVKPLAELAIRGDKLRFTVKPTKQYPNLRMTDEIISLIEKSVDRFMKATFSTKILISDDKKQGIRKEWHQL